MNTVRGFGVWCARAVSLIVFSACRLLEGLESELEMVSFIAVGKCVTVILDHENLVPLQLLRPQVCGSLWKYKEGFESWTPRRRASIWSFQDV